MNIVKEYIYYCFKAKNRHGVHSPFVYDFTDKCIQSKFDTFDKKRFKQLKKLLLTDQRIIQIKDLGAGSKKMSNERKIKTIAKVSSSGNKYGKLLYKIARHYQPQNMLELGTSLGIGSFMLSTGFKAGTLDTVEACPSTAGVARQYLKEFCVSNVNFHIESFDEYILKNKKNYDLVFIDGNHRGDYLLKVLEQLNQFTHDETLFILDDIRWNSDMKQAWQTIVNNEKYHLTMDLFRMGIILKRHHQQKEHFVIKG